MIENTHRISTITIETETKNFCPIGKDYYTNQFTIYFSPYKAIPDYCELDKWVENNIYGKSLMVEDAVALLFDYLSKEYQPAELEVESYIEDAKHCKVTVSKHS